MVGQKTIYNILIIEDQQLVLDGIAAIVTTDSSFIVTGKLSCAKLTLDFLKTNKTDLVLADICTENGNNFLDYVAPIKKEYPKIKIIVMTAYPEITFVERAREGGADSFVYKDISGTELVNLLKSTLAGYNTYPNRIIEDHGISKLTQRELSVLRLVCEGFDRKSIAKELELSENSIKIYISNILSATGFASIAQLAIFAVSGGFIIPRG